jgi:hypothetical protein
LRCIGIASGGWVLLACGLVGGALGGTLVDSIVYPSNPAVALDELQGTGKLTNSFIFNSPYQAIWY